MQQPDDCIEAIDVIELNRGMGGLNIVFSAGREMRPWRTVPVVQDVYDRLHDLRVYEVCR
jgi:hypothetical protein